MPETLYEIEDIAHMPIPLPDGTTLSARVWMPQDCGPVPVILEYLPYRKRDGTAIRDALTHPWLAARGYACVRVDMRGCGDSEGLFEDEYSEQELADGVDVVNWLANQAWCSGAVGMMGISWGGFNGLQIAALAPEPLKAVITICSTVDRFADDIHYKGGIMLGENPGWAATAASWFSMPPDPFIVGDRWRDMWLERLENTPFLLEEWSSHQTRDAYWRHGSVCEDYTAIKAAVLSIGGWHDGYRNTISHLVEHLDAPVKGIIGPWNHKYPHIASPSPQIDFLGEALRWWDHWLKGQDSGVEEDPPLRAYVMDTIKPAVSFTHRPGRWLGLDWPQHRRKEFHLNGTKLSDCAGTIDRELNTFLACGQATGEYFPFGFGPGELPDNQLVDDAQSCCFDSDELADDLTLLGAAELSVRVSSDCARGQLAVRLCDLRPDGTSALIAHGFLNLRFRDGFDKAVPLTPERSYDVKVVLDQCGYKLPAGHRLRIAISSSYWPFVFPEGQNVTLTLHRGTLSLPVLPEGAGTEYRFAPSRTAPPLPTQSVAEGADYKRIIKDVATGQITHDIQGDKVAVKDLNTGLTSMARVNEQFSILENDPASALASFTWERSLARDEWNVSSHAVIKMRGQRDHFDMSMELRADENGKKIFEKIWEARVPRA